MTTNNCNQMLTVSSIPITITRKAVKHMRLAIYPPEGDVRVTAPLHYTESNIRLAVVSRLQWIKQQQALFLNQARQTQREMVSGETHYLWGQAYELRVTYQHGQHRICPNGRYLELFVRPNTLMENRERVLSQYYRKQIKARIPDLLNKWQAKLGVEASDWGIKRMKTKWGSCNTRDKRIWLNLELVKKPLPCLEYVVVHELVHLLESSHNHQFLALMDELLPAWKALRKELNDEYLANEVWR
jgi:predicted metal-dependent hydrolase